MHGDSFFIQAFIYLGAAVLLVPLAKKSGLGSVLGYLIAGIIIGPFVLGLVGEEGQDVMHFAEFGVVMMLFVIGLELQPSLLWKLRIPILGLGGLQVVGTMLVLCAIAMVSGYAWQKGLAIGMILALSSTAIVLQTLQEKGLMKSPAGQNAFSVLLFQDIAVIPMLSLLPLLAIATANHVSDSSTHESHGWLEGLSAWAQAGIVLLILGAVILAGIYVVRPILRMVAKTGLREIFTATALLLVVGIAILMAKIGLSPALGTFLAGVVLAGSEYRHELETDIDPFKGLLLGLFFISVGASINFNLVAESPLTIASLVAMLILIKLGVLFAIGKIFKMKLDTNLMFSFSLAQGGEFAFVLFSFATQNNVLTQDDVGPLVVAVALTMALTPLLMIFNEKVLLPKFGNRENTRPQDDVVDEGGKVIIAGFGRFGSVVGRLLRANGVYPTVLDLDPDNVELLRKLGLKVFYGDAARVDLLHAAGAESAELLIIALDDGETAKELTHTVRKHFPHLKILARSTTWNNSFELEESTGSKAYLETMETSLVMGADALHTLGFRAYQAHRMVKKFKRRDREIFDQLSRVRHNQKEFVRTAREQIKNLEEMMVAEATSVSLKDQDSGWDPESIRTEVKKMYSVAEKNKAKKKQD